MFATINPDPFIIAVYIYTKNMEFPIFSKKIKTNSARTIKTFTKNMPIPTIFYIFMFTASLVLGISAPVKPSMADHTAIKIYYVRYDLKSSSHQISDESLLMVPAENEFRTEKFALFSIPCVISMTQGESKNRLIQRAKEAAVKKIVTDRGLKSVKTRNLVTIVSYEGVINTPIQISRISVKDSKFFTYTAEFEFSPLSFPDQWKSLQMQSMIKEKLNDLFLLFQ